MKAGAITNDDIEDDDYDYEFVIEEEVQYEHF